MGCDLDVKGAIHGSGDLMEVIQPEDDAFCAGFTDSADRVGLCVVGRVAARCSVGPQGLLLVTVDAEGLVLRRGISASERPHWAEIRRVCAVWSDEGLRCPREESGSEGCFLELHPWSRL